MIAEEPRLHALELGAFALNPGGGGLVAIEFVVGKFTCLEPAPRFRAETPQLLGPFILRIKESVRMQTRKEIKDRTPRAEKIAFCKLLE